MARGITATVQTEVEKAEVSPVFFIQLDFSTVLYFWTGLGEMSWNSKTWVGSGDVIKIGGIEETNAIQANGIQLQISGTDLTFISLALDEDVQGRPASLWLGFVDSAGAVLADPVGPFEYLMDTLIIDEAPPISTITLTAESYLASLERERPRRYTHEDQQIEFPGDTGLEYVASIQNKDIAWGRG